MQFRNARSGGVLLAFVHRYQRLTGRGWSWTARRAGAVIGRVDRHRRGPVVLVPPTVSGSFGDEALVAAAHHDLVRRGLEVALMSWDRHPPTGSGSIRAARRTVPAIGWAQLWRRHPAAVVVLGADVVNGYYSDWASARTWDLATFAAAAGVPTSVVGCSWNVPAGCGPGAVRAVRAATPLVRVSCRDAVSAARLSHVVGAPVPDGADLAFLLVPDASPPPDAVAGLAALPADFRATVLNINGGLLGPAADEEALVDKVGSQLAALEDELVGVLLVPHGVQGARRDIVWAEAVLAAARRHRARFTTVVVPSSAAAAQAVARAVDGVVTGRMHLAIGALGVGTPARALDYQGKVEGLGRLFPDCDLCVRLTPDEFVAASGDLVLDVLRHAEAERAAIAVVLPDVRARAASLLAAAVDGLVASGAASA